LNPESDLKSFSFEEATIGIQKPRGLFRNRSQVVINKKQKQAKLFREVLGANVTLDMVQISRGKFIMGTDETEIERLCKIYKTEWFKYEKPQRLVEISSFFMGRYPITQAQWYRIANSAKVKIDLDPDPSDFKNDYKEITRWNRPVENVSWFDAIEFCARLSNKTQRFYRLPSEAEWEYACRAGKATPFHFGETISTELANYDGTSSYGQGLKGKYRGQTIPVGYFKVANNFGLSDMHGNVWELCGDDWHNNYENAPLDGRVRILPSSDMKVMRGGSWLGNPHDCRLAIRHDCDPHFRFYSIGFRVACSVSSIFCLRPDINLII